MKATVCILPAVKDQVPHPHFPIIDPHVIEAPLEVPVHDNFNYDMLGSAENIRVEHGELRADVNLRVKWPLKEHHFAIAILERDYGWDLMDVALVAGRRKF